MRTLIIFSVFGFLIAACGEKMDPTGVDAGEPDSGTVPDPCGDDTAPCALTPGTMMQEHIGAPMDVDHYTFAVPSAGTVLQLTVSNDAEFSPIKLDVVLFSPSNVPVRMERYEGNGKQRIDIQYVATEAGTYRVIVSDVGRDQADRRNPYFIVVSLFSETDMNEPNDDAMRATLLTGGMGTSGTIGSQGDNDWFAIDVAANQLMVISMTASGGAGAVRLRYELYKPDGITPIAQGFEPAGAMTSLRENRAVGNEAGRYLVKIFDEDNNDADLMRVYVLTISFEAEPDVNDLMMPNESRTFPTPILSGATVTGYIAAKSDLDYYAINVTGASEMTPRLITVEANMANSGPVDLALLVYKPSQDELVCDEADSCKAFRFVPEGPERPTKLATSHYVTANGRYLIVVKDNQDDEWDTSTSYTMRAEVLADPDTNERYEFDRGGARVIAATTGTVGATIQYPWVEGYISYADDEDWFSFDIPGPMGAPAGQNGDWMVQLEVQKQGPTPVELQVFFFPTDGQYGGYGHSCRMPAPGDPDPTGLACQFPEDMNVIDELFGEANSPPDCLVVFREETDRGPHFFRITDLNRDDFDVRAGIGAYRFRVTLTARCPSTSVCAGQFVTPMGVDFCGGR